MTKEQAKALLEKASRGEPLTEQERARLAAAIKIVSAIHPL